MKKSNLFLTLIILPLFVASCLVDPPEELTGYDVVKKASYTVIHLQQNSNGSGYIEYEREILEGIINTDTEAVAKEYSGFSVVSFNQKTINETGNTIVQIKYDRNKYSVILDANGGTFSDGTRQKNYLIRYGKDPVFEIPVYENKRLKNWSWNDQTVQELPTAITSENQGTYKAVWEDAASGGQNNPPETPGDDDPEDDTPQTPGSDPSIGGNDDDDGEDEVMYTIIIKRNNGTPDTPYVRSKDSPFPELEEPTREGFSFAGWEPALPATVTENAAYEATWRVSSTVTMVSISLNDPSDIKVDYGNTGYFYTFTATDGFDYYRWFINGTEVSEHTANMTINTISMNAGIYKIFVIAEKNTTKYPVSAELVLKIE